MTDDDRDDADSGWAAYEYDRLIFERDLMEFKLEPTGADDDNSSSEAGRDDDA